MDGRVILKVIWLPCVLVLVFCAIFYWHSRSIARLDLAVSDKTGELTTRLKTLKSVGDYQVKLAAFDDQIRAYKDDLFDLDDAVSMVKAMASLANKHRVKFIDFKYDIPKYIQQKRFSDNTSAFIVPFESKLTGNYSDVGKLFRSLETKVYVLDIYDIKLQSDPESEDGVQCDFRGAVRFFERAKPGMANNG
ncbi:MAG: hypothetical protein GY839_21955 [candidate division Zixibacteria bacterium]|nr:hypothetical protein [candidate division Zixibacteria bacterium]